jgi:hypothetical protein
VDRQQNTVDAELMSWHDLEERHAWSGILIGNGASRTVWEKFRYESLYQTAKTSNIEHQLSLEDRQIFEQLGTENFEQILGALAISEFVCDALHMDPTIIAERYGSIKAALFEAVHFVHVPWQSEDEDIYTYIRNALLPYEFVYSTNYDLIIYWAIMSQGGDGFKDYFFDVDGRFDLADTEIWGKFTKVLYLHGGIHLARLPLGGTLKCRAGAFTNLLDSMEIPRHDEAIPLFITEGTSRDKLGSIYRSDYLSFAYQQFAQHSGPLVVFGSSLDVNHDDHLVKAMSRWFGHPIAISVYPNTPERDIIVFKADLQRRLPDARLYFFDSTTAPLGSSDLRVADSETI